VAPELGDEQVMNRFARFASTAIDAFDLLADVAEAPVRKPNMPQTPKRRLEAKEHPLYAAH
jgi:hypothetical protein